MPSQLVVAMKWSGWVAFAIENALRNTYLKSDFDDLINIFYILCIDFITGHWNDIQHDKTKTIQPL